MHGFVLYSSAETGLKTVGASLLAKAVCQATSPPDVTASSRASSLLTTVSSTDNPVTRAWSIGRI
ncbi:hypothetical protein [Pseudomonas fluorescens]|nr:hypothetical protein [Pseudomonas fluorescens]